MFLGPIEQSKPWDTKGIDGVNRFLRKFWKLYYDGEKFIVNDEKADAEELKTLHKLIGKVQTDIETFSYNTCISAFMIAVNDQRHQKAEFPDAGRHVLDGRVILARVPCIRMNVA